MSVGIAQSVLVWVSNYKGKQVALPGSRDVVLGFQSELKASLALSKGEDGARESLFKSGQARASIELGHVLYFAGHGTHEGPLFNDGLVASYKEVQFGEGLLAVAVFDCCRVLQRFEQWQKKKAFSGLHYLLGFQGDIRQSNSRGQRFAIHLNQKDSFYDAWRKACIETGGPKTPWFSLRAVSKMNGMIVPPDEVWSLKSPPENDPTPPLAFIPRFETPGVGGNLHGHKVVRRRVSLYACERTEGQGTLIKSFAEALELPPGEASEDSHSFRLTHADYVIEAFKASYSFSFVQRHREKRKLFEPPNRLPGPPAVDFASGFLNKFGLGESSLFQELSSTTELHQVAEKQSVPWILAYHVDLATELEGLPVVGPGARKRVTTESDKLDEFFLFNRKTVAQGEVDILTADQAELLLRRDVMFAQIPSGAIETRDWRLGYFVAEPWEDQDFLLPVYAFDVRISLPLNPDYSLVFYVQAVPATERSKWPEESIFHRPTVFS